jgi:NTP pyrophosphatase (non-canonical NTP hydrolase)
MMNIQNAQLEVDNWIKDHGVRYFNELTNMAQLTEEVGEVARIIARRYGEQSEKESDKNKDLGEELADVVFVVLCLANQTGIDLQSAFDKKMDIKTNRDMLRQRFLLLVRNLKPIDCYCCKRCFPILPLKTHQIQMIPK